MSIHDEYFSLMASARAAHGKIDRDMALAQAAWDEAKLAYKATWPLKRSIIEREAALNAYLSARDDYYAAIDRRDAALRAASLAFWAAQDELVDRDEKAFGIASAAYGRFIYAGGCE